MTGTERLYAVVNAILETVQEAGPHGAPSGPMYAAVQGYLSLDQYTKVMAALEQTGKVKRSGHVYFAEPTCVGCGQTEDRCSCNQFDSERK